jgi:hypothetical protein
MMPFEKSGERTFIAEPTGETNIADGIKGSFQ